MGMVYSTMCEPEQSPINDNYGQAQPTRTGDEAIVSKNVPIFSREEIDDVQRTWAQAKTLGVEAVAKLVFSKIFELAPGAIHFFSFRGEEPSKLYESGGRLETHAMKVVGTLDAAVSGMSNLHALFPMLKALGLRHLVHEVREEHYNVVNQAIELSLQSALESQWTDPARESWGKFLKTIKDEMLLGASEADAWQIASTASHEHIIIDLVWPEVDVSAPVDDRDIHLVQHTWGMAKKLGYSALGRILLQNIFTAAPEALQLFSFKDEVDPGMYAEGGRLDAHGIKLLTLLDAAIGLLGQHDAAAALLESLGMRHGALGVVAAHYDIVGQAVVDSLAKALEKQSSTAVVNAWVKVFALVKSIMVGAADEAAKIAAAAAKGAVPKNAAKRQPPAKKKHSTADAKNPEAATDATASAEAATDDATAVGTVDAKEAKTG